MNKQSLSTPLNKSEGVKKIEFGVFEDPNLGIRQGMEDFTICEEDLLGDGGFAFFCVLDGHGGQNVSKYLKENYPKVLKSRLESYKKTHTLPIILKMSIENIENQLKMIGGRDVGSTFCGVLIDRFSARYYVINIGDSRALLAHNFPPMKTQINFLTSEHKVSNPDEAERVKKSGGVIMNGRLAGNLLVTRSMGDFDFKKYGLTSTPDITEHDIGLSDLLIIASDGIWDVVDEADIDKIISNGGHNNVKIMAKTLSELAVNKGSGDNISIILIKLAF